jgi:hypothetical protein
MSTYFYPTCEAMMQPPNAFFIEKKIGYFTLLCKLLSKPSRPYPSTMASADYRISIPLLPDMHSPNRNDSKMVLTDCCMHRRRMGGTKAALGQWRPPWLKRIVSGAHFVCVLCAILRRRNHRLHRK